MRKQIAAANWKMNLTLQEAEALINELLLIPHTLNENQEAVFGVPFPYLQQIKSRLAGRKQAFVAAQNCHEKKSGAFTGEVSAGMLKSIGVDYVILGHSERREYFNENSALLAEKINVSLEYGLKPIFCCGEPLSVREAGNENDHVESQLTGSLFHLRADQLKDFVIAYEPIWAIGTGRTATSEQAQQMHAHIRKVMADTYGARIAGSISILYGGSVKPSNATEIFGQPDVDGGLVGGASLVASDFASIINSLK